MRQFVIASLLLYALWGFALPQAGSIDSISPAAARKGETVTIHGRGFGAINVQITVGGVPAVVLSAYGDRATFRVPGRVKPGHTQVTATNPGFQSGSIDFLMLEGILLPGNPDAPAVQAFTDLPPVSVDPALVIDSIITTRLVLRLNPGATVGQLNAALVQVEGGIVSMLAGFPTITIAVPQQATIQDLLAIAQTLQGSPGIQFASVARVLAPREVPPNIDLADVDYLLPTRFPAAWSARKLVENCPGGKVPVLIPDNFGITPPDGFATQVPGFQTPEGTSGTNVHGYDVTTTLAAMFDGDLPTGANPFTNCLDVMGIDVGVLSVTDALHRIKQHFPGGKFIMSVSLGYKDDPPVAQLSNLATPPLDRALDALDWKTLTVDRWGDFLVANSAGNEADVSVTPGTQYYSGLGQAAFDSPVNVAAKTDPLFGFVQNATFWSYPLDPTDFPPLTATDFEYSLLQADIFAAGMQQTVADNVLVTGSATSTASGTEGTFSDLVESSFSDRGPDIKAIGKGVIVLGPGVVNGTSFAAPQVAGLASYLWLLSPDLRNMPVQTTLQAILQNARNTPQAAAVIDAYATVLSLDPAGSLCTSNPCIRLALLDVTGDGRFDENDLILFLQHYFLLDAQSNLTDTQVAPSSRDYGRFDLNGDGFTGGSDKKERFDLDRMNSTQYGHTDYFSPATQQIEDQMQTYDKSAVTDLDILCYYAYSSLYTGDTSVRHDLLATRCLKVKVTVMPTAVNLAQGGTQQFSATVTGNSDPRVKWTATCGSIDPDTGFYTAPMATGPCTVRATSVAVPSAFGQATVTVTAGVKVGLLSESCSIQVVVPTGQFTTAIIDSKQCPGFLYSPGPPAPPPPFTPGNVQVGNTISDGSITYSGSYMENISAAQVAGNALSGGTLDFKTEADSIQIPAGTTPSPGEVWVVGQANVRVFISDDRTYKLSVTGQITSNFSFGRDAVSFAINCGSPSTTQQISLNEFSGGFATPFAQPISMNQLMARFATDPVTGQFLPSSCTLGILSEAEISPNAVENRTSGSEVKVTFTIEPVGP